ncbi:MAG: hypothetical protein AUG49_25575 [Catenulispora sp. 13_1_20CM_3_70_7]|jgi:hypothetical protein|nr:MAG: hypothetical protein AUG49_25575 [Catenulispora sp. 13_1_20CM_3_70_7]
MTESAAEEPNVILTGGSDWSSPEDRIRFVPPSQEKVKVYLGNRYEHYEPTPETIDYHGRRLRIFAWSGTTTVAE